MKITFKKVELHSFLSFEDEIINFDDFKGMTRIKGYNYDDKQLNGAGKSVIINSIVYGLFGQLPFKLKNDNVYNRFIDDHNTRVCVYFDCGNKHYKVVSGLKGRQSYCNVYEITKEGVEKDLSKSSIAETRNFIENEILHCDINIFMRTVIMNDDEDLNFYKLNASDKKEFIDKLFDISIFGDMYQMIHRDVLDLEKEIMGYQNQLIILNKNSDDIKIKIDEFEENKKNNIELLTVEYDDSVKTLEEKIRNVTQKNEELIAKYNDAILKIDKNISKLSDDIRKNDMSIRMANTDLRNINGNITDKNKIISKHSELYEKLCDDCKGIYSDYHNLKKYQKDISELENKKNSIFENIKTMTEKQNEFSDKTLELNDKKNKLNEKLRELTSTYENEQRQIRQLEISVNSIKTRLENFEKSVNPYNVMLEDNSKNIENINGELEELTKKYKYIKFSENIVNQDNLKKFIIKDLIGILNNRIKFYLHKLGASYDIVFDENMNYEFIDGAKSGIEFNNFSKGQKARITIATCFAFRDFLSTRSNITSNIFMLDEFFDSNVDPMALENIIEILKEFVTVNKQKIFIVSHRSEISDDIFNKIIMVERRNRVSKMKINKV